MSECDEKGIATLTQANTNISLAAGHTAKLEEVFKSKVSQIRNKKLFQQLNKKKGRLAGLF